MTAQEFGAPELNRMPLLFVISSAPNVISSAVERSLHAHARGGSQCREYGRDYRRYDLQRPLQRFLLRHSLSSFLFYRFYIVVISSAPICHPERPICHPERPICHLERSREISPRATLGRDDRGILT